MDNLIYVHIFDETTIKHFLRQSKLSSASKWSVNLHTKTLGTDMLIKAFKALNETSMKNRVKQLLCIDSYYKGRPSCDITPDVIDAINDYFDDNQTLKLLVFESWGSRKDNDWMFDIIRICLPGNIVIHTLGFIICEHVEDDVSFFKEEDIKDIANTIKQTYIKNFDMQNNVGGGKLKPIMDVCLLDENERELPIKSKTKSAAKRE